MNLVNVADRPVHCGEKESLDLIEAELRMWLQFLSRSLCVAGLYTLYGALECVMKEVQSSVKSPESWKGYEHKIFTKERCRH